MLRFQDNYTFQDPLGRTYATADPLLTLPQQITIYAVAGVADRLFVRFPADAEDISGGIRVMSAYASDQMAKNNVLWPEMECRDLTTDAFCGFLAAAIPVDSQMQPMDQWMARNRGQIDERTALKIGLGLARCMQTLHETGAGYVMGAPEPRDFYVSDDGTVCCYHACQYGLQGQVLAGRYMAPELICGQGGATPRSDAFSFALILFELLTGFFPYGAHVPEQEASDQQIRDWMLDSESLYYYADVPVCAQILDRVCAIDQRLDELFYLTFDYCGQSTYDAQRPSLQEWTDILEKILSETSRRR